MPAKPSQRPAVTQPLSESYRYIPLTQGFIAIVDVEDFERISQNLWKVHHAKHTDYASRTISGGTTRMMHREILGCQDKMEVDHKNHSGLDNRKENLRVCTRSQNNHHSHRTDKKTSSKFRGVYLKKDGKWCAQIKIKGKKKYLGRFSTEREAALAYDAAARELHGEFATLNWP